MGKYFKCSTRLSAVHMLEKKYEKKGCTERKVTGTAKNGARTTTKEVGDGRKRVKAEA